MYLDLDSGLSIASTPSCQQSQYLCPSILELFTTITLNWWCFQCSLSWSQISTNFAISKTDNEHDYTLHPSDVCNEKINIFTNCSIKSVRFKIGVLMGLVCCLDSAYLLLPARLWIINCFFCQHFTLPDSQLCITALHWSQMSVSTFSCLPPLLFTIPVITFRSFSFYRPKFKFHKQK